MQPFSLIYPKDTKIAVPKSARWRRLKDGSLEVLYTDRYEMYVAMLASFAINGFEYQSLLHKLEEQ